MLSMQSCAGKDLRLIAVSIDYFPLCSPRIPFSAFPSNISLIVPSRRMSKLQNSFFFLQRIQQKCHPHHRLFWWGCLSATSITRAMQTTLQLTLAPSLCSTELVKSGDKRKQSRGRRFDILLLLLRLFPVSVYSQYGGEKNLSEHFFKWYWLKWSEARCLVSW